MSPTTILQLLTHHDLLDSNGRTVVPRGRCHIACRPREDTLFHSVGWLVVECDAMETGIVASGLTLWHAERLSRQWNA